MNGWHVRSAGGWGAQAPGDKRVDGKGSDLSPRCKGAVNFQKQDLEARGTIAQCNPRPYCLRKTVLFAPDMPVLVVRPL